ncbi:hypothetical protein KIN20_001132 [Parelaphostrongylus tenuis]|uniref:Uncharacterized protein n=1 Tax=Parelaphostrongylus tenuis TaxID=148309 RepID=A0AAD5MES1_PARTN|nr:hypothetical protein KIN20_001132 [Parelaphostrongylus tenuis]
MVEALKRQLSDHEEEIPYSPRCGHRGGWQTDGSRERPSTGVLSRLVQCPDHQRRSAVEQTIGRGQTRDA